MLLKFIYLHVLYMIYFMNSINTLILEYTICMLLFQQGVLNMKAISI